MYWQQLKTSVLSVVVWTVLLGFVYPLVVTVLSQAFFHDSANGSLLYSDDGRILGSRLIGQPFDGPNYFWSRLSATTPMPYNASNSSGSNLGPTNPALIQEVQTRIQALRAIDPYNRRLIPVDLVTSSASGLDPHISVAAARYQLDRVARERHLSVGQVDSFIHQATEKRFLGLLGETGVNVLRLNLALDALENKRHG